MISVALPEQVRKPEGSLAFYVIYDHPLDAPHAYVLRPQYVIRNQREPVRSSICWYAASADELRSIMPPGATCLGRQENDDPAILEVWIE